MSEDFNQRLAAAESGNANAQCYLGWMYDNGIGISKDPVKAIIWYRKAADQGEAIAQINLGVMYTNGHGVAKDEAKAVEWYRKAAEQGNASAQFNLGWMYANGRGVVTDDAKAVEWYRKAAEQGNANAQFNLGCRYATGHGVPKDDAKAVDWYRKSAEKGNADAQVNLGWMYEYDRGVPKDDAKAVEWYRKSAEQGRATAQFNLGLMYANGRGVPKDDAKAVEWYTKAANQGHAEAKTELAKRSPPPLPAHQPQQTKSPAPPTTPLYPKQNLPAPDCKPLLDVCTPELYANNPFRITRLHVHASPRDIRRRHEDLKAVEGTPDWQHELKHAFSHDPLPSSDHINTAFQRLLDPETRLIDELFWFWPLTPKETKIDQALDHLQKGYEQLAHEIWDLTRQTTTGQTLPAIHNLAVYHHLLAIDGEVKCQQSSSSTIRPETLQEIIDHWKKTIEYWELLADEDDFWAIVSDRIRTIDDPRLTTGFARRLRATFPIAFDQINALLAKKYAESGHFQHARRHVKYMTETHSGLDDVDRTVRTIFAPLEKSIGLLIEHAVAESHKTPETGLKRAKELLTATKEPLAVAKGLLDDGHAVRRNLFDNVADACFSCLIAYGNKTKDWKPCYELLTTVETLAVSQEAKIRIHKNRDVAKNNYEAKELHETCWFCKQAKAVESAKLEVVMYGDVNSERTFTGTRTTWRHVSVSILRCSNCMQQHASAPDGTTTGGSIVAMVGLIIGAATGGITGALIFAAIGFGLGAWIGGSIVSKDNAWIPSAKTHPNIKELLSLGWNFGDRP